MRVRAESMNSASVNEFIDSPLQRHDLVHSLVDSFGEVSLQLAGALCEARDHEMETGARDNIW